MSAPSPRTSPPRAVRVAGLFVVAPAIVGVATGACVAVASTIVEGEALGAVMSLPGILPVFCTPFALLLTLLVVMYVTRATSPSTAELYITTYHDPAAHIPLRQLPGRVLAAATTVGLGGAQGLESPSALIGAGVGDVLGRWRAWQLEPEETRALMVAGASAGIAAVFSSPALGTFYGMEVPFRRDVDAPRFVPCAIAAAASYVTRGALAGVRHLVDPGVTVTVDPAFLLGVALVAVGCGIGARIFAEVDEWLQRHARSRSRLERAIVGGAGLAALTWTGHALAGRWVTFGPGYLAVDWLFDGVHPMSVVAALLVVRASTTLVCVYGGGGGGVFTSLACCGVFVGQLVASLLGTAGARVYPLIGAACFLGAGYRLPVGTAMLVAESSGDLAVAAAGLVAVAVAQVFMGDQSVSEAKADHRVLHRTAAR